MPNAYYSTVPVIAIDGPTASGKGAVAQAVAAHLGFHYLDSGALYRLVALLALDKGWQQSDELTAEKTSELVHWANTLNVVFDVEHGGEYILLNNIEVSARIREEATGNMASKIAVCQPLRAALLQRQRDFAQSPGLVADGRDMGSVVFPNAPLKIFLNADATVRAERRYKQLIGKGFSANMADLLHDLQARDARDMSRAHAPLKPVEGAIVLDSSSLTLDETVKAVLDLYAAVADSAAV